MRVLATSWDSRTRPSDAALYMASRTLAHSSTLVGLGIGSRRRRSLLLEEHADFSYYGMWRGVFFGRFVTGTWFKWDLYIMVLCTGAFDHFIMFVFSSPAPRCDSLSEWLEEIRVSVNLTFVIAIIADITKWECKGVWGATDENCCGLASIRIVSVIAIESLTS